MSGCNGTANAEDDGNAVDIHADVHCERSSSIETDDATNDRGVLGEVVVEESKILRHTIYNLSQVMDIYLDKSSLENNTSYALDLFVFIINRL